MPKDLKVEKKEADNSKKFDVHKILQKSRISKDDGEAMDVAISAAESNQSFELLQEASSTEEGKVASNSFNAAASLVE